MQHDYKKKYFKLANGMNEKLLAGEDYDFCQRIIQLNKKFFSTKTRLFSIMIDL